MKEKKGVKQTMGFPAKKQLSFAEPMEVEKAVQRIHSNSGKVTRLSLDVSAELYPALKMRQIQKGFKTTRAYLLALVEADLQA
jgi:hypothetical protein